MRTRATKAVGKASPGWMEGMKWGQMVAWEDAGCEQDMGGLGVGRAGQEWTRVGRCGLTGHGPPLSSPLGNAPTLKICLC